MHMLTPRLLAVRSQWLIILIERKKHELQKGVQEGSGISAGATRSSVGTPEACEGMRRTALG